MNITDLLREQARLKPDATAIVRPGGRKVSYAEFDRAVDGLAQRALDSGVRAGQAVALDLIMPYEFFALSLALARIGAAAASVKLPGALADFRFRVLNEPSTDRRLVRVSADWFAPPEANVAVAQVPAAAGDDAICRIFPTSGTVGESRHVAVTHAKLVLWMRNRNRFTPLPPAPCQIFAPGPMGGYGFRESMRVLQAGGTIVFCTSVAEILDAIPRDRVNRLVAAPSLLRDVAVARAEDAGPFPTLLSIEVGGSQLSRQVLELIRARLCPSVFIAYGSTEVGPVASASADELANSPTIVGRVHEGVDVQAVDDDDRPLPPGTEGVIRVRSELGADGYFGDPEASAKVFRGGWFYPGDTGAVAADRMLSITGRVEDLINIGGEKISPLVVENFLGGIPGIADVAVFGLPDNNGITQVWAAVVVKRPVQLQLVFKACRLILGRSSPSYIFEVGELPRNEAGKIQRRALADIARARQAGSQMVKVGGTRAGARPH